VRYLVTARVKPGQATPLAHALERRTLGRGSVAGAEYLRNMAEARQLTDGRVVWVETCFCATPLDEERPYWEEFFDLLRVKDGHSRRRCRHETGEEPWACSACDCTAKLEATLKARGTPFEPTE
jgi:hypothetical protein